MSAISVRMEDHPVWMIGQGPKEYGSYLLNKRGYSHKRTNRK